MQNRKRDTDVQNRLLDSVGEGEGGMFQENSIKTHILSRVKQITSPGWMHETSARGWCTGKTQRDWVERKVGYIYTMEYYSAIKKNSFESVLMRWMKLEPIIQSEVRQKDKDQYSILTHIYMEFRKMVMITLYAKQKKRHRCTEQTFGLCGRSE